MKTAIPMLFALALSACGGGTDPNDPCIGMSYRDHPECVPPIPLPAPAPDPSTIMCPVTQGG